MSQDDEFLEGELKKLDPRAQELLRERDENLRAVAMRHAAVAIMARNFSHNIGIHIRSI
jgi:hypothetical protein